MPARPRSEVFDGSEVGVYHCWNRIVRRRHLLGADKLTGKDYSYRKDWLREQFRALTAVMAIQILDYAILCNHLHVVLRNRPDIVESWSDDEVARRWWNVCPRRRRPDGTPAEPKSSELREIRANIDEYRSRLSDISWLMRLAQQRVARRANKEDDVDGRFFAKRFDCERLTDLESLLKCSLYVDLNCIHAGMTDRPEASPFTSAYERIQARWQEMGEDLGSELLEAVDLSVHDDWLAPIPLDDSVWHATPESKSGVPEDSSEQHPIPVNLADPIATPESKPAQPPLSNPLGAQRVSDKGFLPMTLDEYLELLDTVGKTIRLNKRGAIPRNLPPVLERLGIKPQAWFKSVVGHFWETPNIAILGQT